MIKLLIVDDSALMRKYLRETFEAEGDFEIRTARNGLDALEQLKSYSPDVITLDINMPEMDGITCLSRIMVELPKPVVMVSSLTEKDAIPTLECLALGAVDYIAKPGGTISLNINQIKADLIKKIRAAARARVSRARNLVARINSGAAESPKLREKASFSKEPTARLRVQIPGLLLVGASTGGPRTVEEILTNLPANYPFPVLLSIHMPGTFTGQYAKRLNNICELEVVEVIKPVPVEPGRVYIAAGDADMLVRRRFSSLVAESVPMGGEHPWHPSVDRMVFSVLEHFDATKCHAVLLTGMGFDGAEAMTKLRAAGGRTIAESEETAVVFGMPKELIDRNGAEVVIPCDRIARRLLEWTGTI